MSERAEPPTREQVVNELNRLIAGATSREKVSEWASQWVTRLEEIDDPRVCRALDRLSGSDTPTTDRPYLFMEVDFEKWLRELTA